MTPEERTKILAERLVELAIQAGVVVTIEQVSLQPLAMGHYKTVVSVRPARERNNG